MQRPGVGVGVIIENSQGQILVGKRKGSHAQSYSIPGGHLELGEELEEAARKEILEETGLKISHLNIVGISNNLETYRSEGKHYISINFHTNQFIGVPAVLEPEKCLAWEWVNPNDLPRPHFEASRAAVQSWLSGVFYCPNPKRDV